METNETSHNSTSNLFKALVIPILVNELVCIDFALQERTSKDALELFMLTSFVQVFATMFACIGGYIMLLLIKVMFVKNVRSSDLFHKLMPISLLAAPIPIALFTLIGFGISYHKDMPFPIYFLFCAWSASIITTWYFARSFSYENDI